MSGLSQLLSSYGSDESDDSASETSASLSKDLNGDKTRYTAGNSRHKANDERCYAGVDKREILPLPTGLLEMFPEDVTTDDPTKHDGRIRTFSHFPGNWAMHVFVPFKGSTPFEGLVSSLVKSLSTCNVYSLPSDEFHVSVSRTVPVRHYWIDPIVEQLKDGLSSFRRFSTVLHCPEVYSNDEKTRSFVALKIMSEQSKLQQIVDVVDRIFDGFSLPAFYKNPSFHMSVAWFLGDASQHTTEATQKKLQDAFDAYVFDKAVMRSLTVLVNEVHCKIGNKLFVFPLSGT